MSTVVDVSSVLGEYMLKGWILTDSICKKCLKVPLLRSKSSPPSEFCANCDGGPIQQQPALAAPSHASSSSAGSADHSASRPSTPPTEVSTALSSPTFVPPVDMEEITRRRQQSDLASAEIGKVLLKGWTMLADECPNISCYGIPLVRAPRTLTEPNPKKECVVCHALYIDRPGGGLERVEPSLAPEGRPISPIQPGARAPSTFRPEIAGRSLLPDPGDIASTTNLTIRTLQTTAETLEQSLKRLTERLKFFSDGEAFDVAMIEKTAEAITKVTQALIKVKELLWSERQAVDVFSISPP